MKQVVLHYAFDAYDFGQKEITMLSGLRMIAPSMAMQIFIRLYASFALK
jgi:hypothetical protein